MAGSWVREDSSSEANVGYRNKVANLGASLIYGSYLFS